MSDTDKLALAHQACDNLEAGRGEVEIITTVHRDDDPETFKDINVNNKGVYSAAALAYCTDFASGTDDYPDRGARLVAFYQGLGEDGAKEHFADKTMPTPEELGY